jgi:Di-N-acetylchitobiase
LTSIVLYEGLDPAMLCMAHARGVRLIWAASFSTSQLLNDTAKAAWIDATVTNVVNTFTDGVNFDFEDLIVDNSPQEAALTQLTSDLAARLKAAVPTSSMSFDVAWSSEHIDGRYYNYTALAVICDYLVIMDYDTRSQTAGPPCLAGPNSPFDTAVNGVRSFLDLGISPRQVILGEPWYGYVYPCTHDTEITEERCVIASVPFRGSACSDAAGHQWDFGYIQQYLRNATTQVLTPLTVNTSNAPGGSYVRVTVNASTIFPAADFTELSIAAIYFDNADTLRQKYKVAKDWGLRGVSMWNMDSVSFASQDAHETKQIWESLDAYLH